MTRCRLLRLRKASGAVRRWSRLQPISFSKVESTRFGTGPLRPAPACRWRPRRTTSIRSTTRELCRALQQRARTRRDGRLGARGPAIVARRRLHRRSDRRPAHRPARHRPADRERLISRYERYVATARHPELRDVQLEMREQLDELLTELLHRCGRNVHTNQLRRLVAVVDGAVLGGLGELDPDPRALARAILIDVMETVAPPADE